MAESQNSMNFGHYDTQGINMPFRENHVKEVQCGAGETVGEEGNEYRLCGG